MKILITGAAGFVGRHLLEHYTRLGHSVHVLDPEFHEDSTIEHFTTDRSSTTRYDIVYHCGAFIGGRTGIDGLPAYLHTYNTTLDAMMFTWALNVKPKRFVYFSSSAAYPAAFQKTDDIFPFAPLKEDDIDLDDQLPPEATYGLSKLHGEQMARSVAAEVPVTILRPFSGYGEDQSSDYPFPAFIARAKAHEDPYTVWGDGMQVRDWIHISDFIAASTIAAEEGIDGPVNLCTGLGTSFNDLAALCMDLAGYKAPINHLDKGRGNGVDFRVGDPTLMHQFYVPKVSLAEGVERALGR